ncbi:hypothetical protein BGZ97_007083, partial [Linnemannia gamsii]
MNTTYEDATVNSSTTTVNQIITTNSNSTSGTSSPSTDTTAQLRPDSFSDKKTIEASIEEGLHHRHHLNKDEWKENDPAIEVPLSRAESMSYDDDGVVMESGYRGYLVVFGGFL